MTLHNPQELWNQAVSSYVSVPDISNKEINIPAIIRHLSDIRGKTILDYGCGSGHFARQLKKMGAGQVIATDTSEAMIQLAIQADPSIQVNYHTMSGNILSFLPNDFIDRVVANLVFMMAPTAQEIIGSMREILRVLRPGGRFIYVITHPCFIEKGAHDYYNRFEEGFHYMKEEVPYRFILQDDKGKDIDGDFFDYHHTLTTYIKTTIQAGFQLLDFEELSYPDEVIERHAISREFQTFPQSLLLCCMKPPIP